MRDELQVRVLLDHLNENIADDLEGQDLDFKCCPDNIKDAVKKLVNMAVCMANGGGGTVVFGVVRVGKECKPLTGTMRREMMEVSGDSDFTETVIYEPVESLLSASAMERLRQLVAMEKASADFLKSSDADLLGALRLIQHGKLTVAGVLLVGNENAIRQHVPGAGWTWVVQRSDTFYDNREDGASSIPVAITRLEDLIRPLSKGRGIATRLLGRHGKAAVH